MLPRWLLDLGIPAFEGWTIPVAGAVAACLAFVIGRLFFVPRKGPAQPVVSHAPAIDPFLEGATDERRISNRREGSTVDVLITDAEVETTPVKGWVVDRSLGGVCLRAHTSFAVGTILSLRPCNAPTITPWVQVEVKSCRQEENTWDIGCQFLRTPPYSVLLLFG